MFLRFRRGNLCKEGGWVGDQALQHEGWHFDRYQGGETTSEESAPPHLLSVPSTLSVPSDAPTLHIFSSLPPASSSPPFKTLQYQQFSRCDQTEFSHWQESQFEVEEKASNGSLLSIWTWSILSGDSSFKDCFAFGNPDGRYIDFQSPNVVYFKYSFFSNCFQ